MAWNVFLRHVSSGLPLQSANAPELAGNEDLLTRNDALLDRARESFSTLLLVSIVRRSIQEAVARLERVVDRVGSFGGRDLVRARQCLLEAA